MFLLDITSACNDAGLASILVIVKRILGVIQIIGPILAMVSLTIHITMLVKDPEDKKRIPKIRNSAIALVVLFLIPVIVNAAMGLLDDSTELSSCWNNASYNGNNGGGNYVSPYDDNNKSKVYPNPNDYQK